MKAEDLGKLTLKHKAKGSHKQPMHKGLSSSANFKKGAMKAGKMINIENLSKSPHMTKKTVSSHALGRFASINSPCSAGLLDAKEAKRMCISKNNSMQSRDEFFEKNQD